jgi:hypothetical protein
MKSAFAALVSVLLGIAVGLLALYALPGGESSRLGEVMRMLGFVVLPLLLGGFAYRRWFHHGIGPCLAGLGAYALLVAFVAMGVPDSFPEEVFFLLLLATLTPWYAGFLAGKLVGARRPERVRER